MVTARGHVTGAIRCPTVARGSVMLRAAVLLALAAGCVVHAATVMDALRADPTLSTLVGLLVATGLDQTVRPPPTPGRYSAAA